MTAFECLICFEDLISSDNPPTPDSSDDHVLALNPCGHLYHRRCIQRWYNARMTNLTSQQTQQDCNVGKCPTCNTYNTTTSALRVFPVVRNKDADVVAMTEKINQLKKELQENRKLNAELLAENKRSKSKVALQNKLIKQQKEVVESLDAIIAERGRGRILKKVNYSK